MADEQARRFALLVSLKGVIGSIAGQLTDPEMIGVDHKEYRPSTLRSRYRKSPSFAIEQLRKFQSDIYRCEVLAEALADELSRRILIHLTEAFEAVGQDDVPAEMAMLDGHDKEAVAICEDALVRVENQCGPELRRCIAECAVEADLMSGSEMNFISAFGFDPFGKAGFNSIPAHKLAELLRSTAAVKSRVKGKPKRRRGGQITFDPKEDKRIDDAATQSGRDMKATARKLGIPLADVRAAVDRNRKRLRQSGRRNESRQA